MAARLKDVAALAQVSMRTVSNVVNDYPHVSADVRRRVGEAIERLNYQPNLAARTLSSGRTGLLALAAPFPPDLTEQVVRQVAARGMRVVIDPMPRSVPVDAVLLRGDPVGALEAYLAAGTPVVLLGGAGDPRCDHLALDPERAAVEHLHAIGRRRVAVMPLTGGRPSDGYRAARELLGGRPDAIYCADDRLALGALRAVADAGLHVPGDVAVIGVGDSEEGRYSRPALTTVAADHAYVAGKALDLVLARLANPGAGVTRIDIPHVVRVRESTRVTRS